MNESINIHSILVTMRFVWLLLLLCIRDIMYVFSNSDGLPWPFFVEWPFIAVWPFATFNRFMTFNRCTCMTFYCYTCMPLIAVSPSSLYTSLCNLYVCLARKKCIENVSSYCRQTKKHLPSQFSPIPELQLL